MPDPYSRLAPFIREYIYGEKWSALRTIQEAAIGEVFDGKGHILIAAGTASGKTEAAFFPLLSAIAVNLQREQDEKPENDERFTFRRPLVLYISPLKALINDQARRLEKILAAGKEPGHEADIALWRWHGDIPSNHKSRFLENPSGVLLITPESLESLLLRHGRKLKTVFGGLEFVVIDEVHVFMESDRGSQILCQLARIGEAGGAEQKTVRRIGLSATLGDYQGARHWLSRGTALPAALLCDEGTGRKFSIALDYNAERGAGLYRSLYGQCRNKRTIVFTNSRLEAEECAASLGSLALSLGEPDIFRVHHGSISALLRDEAEEELKSGIGPAVTCATATLELGIDLGGLDRIIQLGPPWSVSAFVQRLGRSGRRNGRAEIFFSVQDEALFDPILPWDLLRTMAVVQLYLEEKWIEPPEEKPLPYSLLVHEILGILASLGEHRPEELARRVLSLPPFTRISSGKFRFLTGWLGDCGMIQKTAEGKIILGLEGERIVNRHSFYPVFPGEETFRVMLEGREIGTVNFVPDPLSVLAVGGRRWLVKSIDPKRREIWVAETSGAGSERVWRGRGGGVHQRVADTMRRILMENPDSSRYPYLSPSARQALDKGRRLARKLELENTVLISLGNWGNWGTGLALLPWLGSREMRTVEIVLKLKENRQALKLLSIEQKNDFSFFIETKLPLNEFYELLKSLSSKGLENPEKAVTDIFRQNIPYADKYDYLLPPELLAEQYAANMLDREALGKLFRRMA
jgi:ATP-dependent Lhr-like helicase